jgi:hypothetical protein
VNFKAPRGSSSCLSVREPTSATVFKAEFAAGAALYPQ